MISVQYSGCNNQIYMFEIYLLDFLTFKFWKVIVTFIDEDMDGWKLAY